MSKFERFKQGLKDYNLTYNQIMESGWNYCGGNFNSHLNYYHLRFGATEPLLPHEEECVCGKKGLINNGYICNKKETDFLVFIGGRTCEVCGEGHRRHTRNVCKECEKFQRKVNGKWRTLKTMECEGCNKRIHKHEWKKKCKTCYYN